MPYPSLAEKLNVFASLLAVLSAAGSFGCTGNILGSTGDATEMGGGAGTSPMTPGPTTSPPAFDDAPPDPHSAGPLPMRLLTRIEYQNTLEQLFGRAFTLSNTFPAESQDETGFFKVARVDQVSVAAYQDAALDIAAQVSAKPAELLGCDPSAVGQEDTCIRVFLSSFTPRAYRRPLEAAELEQHLSFYRDTLRGQLGLGAPEALKLLIAALLESPYFLYHWERGSQPGPADRGVVKLNAHHLASQLAYFLWASMPDDELFAAAASDGLDSPVQIEAQARRMLGDPKAEHTVAAFHEQWLGLTSLASLGKAAGLYPQWNPALGSAMAEEFRRFTTGVVLHGDGRFASLLSSRSTYINEPLAVVYGISGVSGTDLVAHELPAAERAGLLTLAGFLTAHSGESEGSPIFRGKFLRERLLCDPMPPPPDNIPPLPAAAVDVGIKQRHLEHAAVSPCKDCHLRMDFIGFGLDNFDALGTYHQTDALGPIDAAGQVYGLDGTDPTFNGPLELMQLLGGSDQVRRCLTKEWFRYAFARREAAADRASFDAAYAAFGGSNYDIRELLVALAKTRSFSYRSLDAGEVLP